MTPNTVFDGQHLRVLHMSSGNNRAIVTFDYRAKEKSDFGASNPSRGFASNGFDQIMIKTRRNDWFINDDTVHMESMLGPLTSRYERVHALGFSMGGFGALRFARSLNADYVVVVSPQFSIDPNVAPFDRRYRTEAANFDADLGRIAHNPQLDGVVIFDPFVRNDARHAELIARSHPHLRNIRLACGGHPATTVLREAGRAGVIQRLAMGLAPRLRVNTLHRVARRGSAAYWMALSRAAGMKHPDLCKEASARAERITDISRTSGT